MWSQMDGFDVLLLELTVPASFNKLITDAHNRRKRKSNCCFYWRTWEVRVNFTLMALEVKFLFIGCPSPVEYRQNILALDPHHQTKLHSML